MTTARSAIAPPGASGHYHCVSRCVRRTFLCGFDKATGQNFEHRRGWIVARMNELAGIYAARAGLLGDEQLWSAVACYRSVVGSLLPFLAPESR
jgi:hypothetical protein